MEAPICCKIPMELKTAVRLQVTIATRLYFQCKKCGCVKDKDCG